MKVEYEMAEGRHSARGAALLALALAVGLGRVATAACTETTKVVTGTTTTWPVPTGSNCSTFMVVKAWGKGGHGESCFGVEGTGGGGGYSGATFGRTGFALPYGTIGINASAAAYVQWRSPSAALQILDVGGQGGEAGCHHPPSPLPVDGVNGGGGGGHAGESTPNAGAGEGGTSTTIGHGGTGTNCNGLDGGPPTGPINGGFSLPGPGGALCSAPVGFPGRGGTGYYGGGSGGYSTGPGLTSGGAGGGGGNFIAGQVIAQTRAGSPFTEFGQGPLGTAPGNVDDPDRCLNLPPDCNIGYGGGGSTPEGLARVVVHFIGPRAFYSTPGDWTFAVPEGVTSVTLKAWGAGGAQLDPSGMAIGGGATAKTVTKTVSPGDQLSVHVGSAGMSSSAAPIEAGEASSVAFQGDPWIVATGGSVEDFESAADRAMAGNGPDPGNRYDIDYHYPAGRGATGTQVAGNGQVVIIY